MLQTLVTAINAADPTIVRAFGYLLVSATTLGTAFGLAAGWALKRR